MKYEHKSNNEIIGNKKKPTNSEAFYSNVWCVFVSNTIYILCFELFQCVLGGSFHATISSAIIICIQNFFIILAGIIVILESFPCVSVQNQQNKSKIKNEVKH